MVGVCVEVTRPADEMGVDFKRKRKQQVDLCEFKASLIYMVVSSSPKPHNIYTVRLCPKIRAHLCDGGPKMSLHKYEPPHQPLSQCPPPNLDAPWHPEGAG